jgi:hypothetical protein
MLTSSQKETRECKSVADKKNSVSRKNIMEGNKL